MGEGEEEEEGGGEEGEGGIEQDVDENGCNSLLRMFLQRRRR